MASAEWQTSIPSHPPSIALPDMVFISILLEEAWGQWGTASHQRARSVRRRHPESAGSDTAGSQRHRVGSTLGLRHRCARSPERRKGLWIASHLGAGVRPTQVTSLRKVPEDAARTLMVGLSAIRIGRCQRTNPADYDTSPASLSRARSLMPSSEISLLPPLEISHQVFVSSN